MWPEVWNVRRMAPVAAGMVLLALWGCGRRSQETAPAAAAEPGPPAQRQRAQVPEPSKPVVMNSLTDLTGDCLRLVVAGEAALECKGVVLNPTYTSGRSSFVFFDPKTPRLVSFTGMSGDDVRHGDIIVQPVDGITLSEGDELNVASKPIRAIGVCRYSNPFTGPASLSCLAETESGLWAGEFRTDGKPPHREEFGEDG